MGGGYDYVYTAHALRYWSLLFVPIVCTLASSLESYTISLRTHQRFVNITLPITAPLGEPTYKSPQRVAEVIYFTSPLH